MGIRSCPSLQSGLQDVSAGKQRAKSLDETDDFLNSKGRCSLWSTRVEDHFRCLEVVGYDFPLRKSRPETKRVEYLESEYLKVIRVLGLPPKHSEKSVCKR